MMKYWKYLKYVVRHKWFVTVECFKVGLYWRGIKHDLSKFRPSEFVPYANYFYGNGDGIKTGRDKSGYYRAGASPDEKFNYAWLLHQKRNDHHWQWWHLVLDEDGETDFPMSNDALLEMVADWKGAGKAISGQADPQGWYEKNGNKMRLHPTSRENLRYILYCKEADMKYFIKNTPHE